MIFSWDYFHVVSLVSFVKLNDDEGSNREADAVVLKSLYLYTLHAYIRV